MKNIIISMIFFGKLALAQEQSVLEEYKTLEPVKPSLGEYKEVPRQAPTELFGKEDYEAATEQKSQQELDKLLDNLSASSRSRAEKFIKDAKTVEIKLALLKIVLKSKFFLQPNWSPIPNFWTKNENKLVCRDISILDAAQRFKEGETILYLKFKLPYTARKRIPENYLNGDMRRAFAIFSTGGNEVAFHNGYDYSHSVTYEGGKIYDARWNISLIGDADVLNKIKCANRQFSDSFLTTKGTYELLEK